MDYLYKKLSLLGVVMFLFSSDLKAVNIQQFSRSNSLTFEMIEDARLSSSHVINHYKWLFNLGFSHVDEPLTIKNANNSKQLDSIVDSMQSIHLGAAIYLKPWWQVALNTSFSHFKNNSNETINDFQDIELKSKFRIYDGKKNAFTLMPIASIPLGGGETVIQDNANPVTTFGKDELLSDNGLGVGLFAIYEHLFRYFQLSANLGYRINSDAEFVDNAGTVQIDKTKILTAGLGVYVPFHEKVGLNIEYLKNFSSPLFNDNLNPSELFLGISGGMRENIHGFAGVGFGNFSSDRDGNDYRIVAGLKFTPGTKPKEYDEERQIRNRKSSKVIQDYRDEFLCEQSYLFGKTNALTILFNHDSSKLSQGQMKKIHPILQVLKKRRDDISSIEIFGHSSSLGDESYNQILGLKRARKIKELLKKNNIPISKIKVIESKGENHL